MNQDSAAASGLWQCSEKVTVGNGGEKEHILWNGQMRCFAILIGPFWQKFHTAVSQILTESIHVKLVVGGQQQTSPGRRHSV